MATTSGSRLHFAIAFLSMLPAVEVVQAWKIPLINRRAHDSRLSGGMQDNTVAPYHMQGNHHSIAY